jgi:tRNA-dihydrouridine synthase B
MPPGPRGAICAAGGANIKAGYRGVKTAEPAERMAVGRSVELMDPCGVVSFHGMFDTVMTRLRDGSTPLYLAPQAGVSESPFRRLCRRFGADVVVSEFVSAEGLRRGSERTHEYLHFDDGERPIGVQIFGADPRAMAEAAALVEAMYAPDFLDINFGCPVKKVVSRNGGSGCLRDLDLVESIIRSVSSAIDIPTTVKIRSGWSDETRNPVEIALRCQDAGAQVLTLHARSRTQMYAGHANWDEIAAVVDALDIPVIGNGDVWTGEDARRMKAHTACAGIMIARGSHGAPWIFAQARAALSGEPVPAAPEPAERFAIVLEHARNAIEFKHEVAAQRGSAEEDDDDASARVARRAFLSSEEHAMREFRKHLGWYTKGLPNGKALREELFAVTSLADAAHILEGYVEATMVAA